MIYLDIKSEDDIFIFGHQIKRYPYVSEEFIMKKKVKLISFCSILIMTIVVLLDVGGSDISSLDERCEKETVGRHYRGILSTGIVYEFRGEFNFNEFRRQCNFYLERGTGNTLIAQTPIEVAELGQFYLLPGLQEEYSPHLELILESLLPPWEHIEGESSIIVVYYCVETDNWVIKLEFPENTSILGEFNIFAINRSNGNVIEFSSNEGVSSGFLANLANRLNGWRRTLR